MQITGDGVWVDPTDRSECIQVLRYAVDMGGDLVDTADSYWPEVSEQIISDQIICEALYP